MERLLKNGLIACRLKHDPISIGQQGFSRKKLYATDITDYLNYITKNLNIGRSVIVIVLDITKGL